MEEQTTGTYGRAIHVCRTFSAAAMAVALAAALALTASQPRAQSTPCGIAMRLLVLSADGTEADLPAITSALDYLGTPYTTYIAQQHPGGLTSAFLGDSCHANYQAVIQTTGGLVADSSAGWVPALTAAEQQALAQYEAQFQIRQVTWYSYPTPDGGFTAAPDAIDTSGAPLPVSITPAGQAIFPYLVTGSAALAIQDAYTYLAFAGDASATPILTDAAGHALALVKRFGDGRENLALTFDSNPYLLHSTIFAYGLVNWATRGIFIGQRHIVMSPQVDDFFIDDERWQPTMACGTDPETSTVVARMTGADMKAIDAWQSLRNQDPITAGVRLTLAFNGEGTTGIYDSDTLTPTAKTLQGHFHWVSHTYDHDLLDTLDYGASHSELTLNNSIASKLGLTDFSPQNLVTPEISGLTNPNFLSAAVDAGVRYVVSDTSKPGYDNPFPNLGINNPIQPSILMIPRRANNLFYNVVAPADWVAEYNCLYQSYWGRALSYDEILSVESGQLLMYLLRGENDPWMFHQPNLVAYDGSHALITDLLDRTLDRYKAIYNLPILSPTMDALGASIAQDMQFHAAHVDATLQPGVGITVSADAAVTVPITGAAAAGAESYGGQSISWVTVANAGASVTVPLAAGSAPVPTLPSGWSHADIGSVGAAGTTIYDGSASTFTVSGGGADVWGTADALQFAYQPVSGDTRVIARVATIQNVNAWTKAGVMIRGRADRRRGAGVHAGLALQGTGVPAAGGGQRQQRQQHRRRRDLALLGAARSLRQRSQRLSIERRRRLDAGRDGDDSDRHVLLRRPRGFESRRRHAGVGNLRSRQHRADRRGGAVAGGAARRLVAGRRRQRRRGGSGDLRRLVVDLHGQRRRRRRLGHRRCAALRLSAGERRHQHRGARRDYPERERLDQGRRDDSRLGGGRRRARVHARLAVQGPGVPAARQRRRQQRQHHRRLGGGAVLGPARSHRRHRQRVSVARRHDLEAGRQRDVIDRRVVPDRSRRVEPCRRHVGRSHVRSRQRHADRRGATTAAAVGRASRRLVAGGHRLGRRRRIGHVRCFIVDVQH